ncbi:histidyl-tRNA synthetase [Nematocida minor]|uniref:histidyl-tRNA synthetase n=1 Tax=Nematocida minor TaxID=1912983 RepID=UPI0022205371|nr:histidyl-tRNA synthetase [Nematocida minor]KAI5192431.1 histidyl-tRNA synthetase [Nematocida minor]
MDQLIKTAKGTRDYAGKDKILIDRIIAEIEKIYKRRGAVPFDTPTFEIKAILMNKYGEDSKLIYDLADQGGELCALRYDLTVPFARYLAMTKTVKMKRYHTAKVFRRDQPALVKGRYREFYQSDFDIVGEYAHMAADAEIVSTTHDVLKNFSKDMKNRSFYIRLNHKKLVDSLMEVCGIDASLAGTIGSSIDKLDKMAWKEVAKEMEEKGAHAESIEKIKDLIKIKGSFEIISLLKSSEIGQTEKGKQAIDDLVRLHELLVVYGVDEQVVLDISLIRGLEYYTGILLEGGYEGIEGTLVAGGRYDGLVNSLFEIKHPETHEIAEGLDNLELSKKTKKKQKQKNNAEEVKCVGVSLGVSRLFSLIDTPEKKTYTEVLVCSVGSNLLEERIKMCVHLRKNKINSEYFMGDSSNFSRHSEYADAIGAEILVLIGRKELEEETFQVIRGSKQNRIKSTVHISNLIPEIKKIIAEKSRKEEENSSEEKDSVDSEEAIFRAQI